MLLLIGREEKLNKKGKKPNDKKYNVVEVVMSEAPINTL